MLITVHSAKGGVGKTTSSLSIASILSELGHKVLLIDLDPQAAATKHLTPHCEKTIRQVLLGEIEIHDAILTPYDNFDFISSQLRLQNIEKELVDENNPLFILSDILEGIEEEYEYVIFDTQPNTGLMTRSAMVASDKILIPTLLEAWPIESLEISFEALEKVQKAQKYINRHMDKIFILPTFYEERRELSTAFMNAICQEYSSYVTNTTIHRSVEIGKTYSTPGARLTKDMRAYQEYLNTLNELLGLQNG
jgi:chromosome partitioning protein